MLSSIGNDINSQSPIAHYHKAKAHADNHLLETDLEYTIVCPGRLTNEPATGNVSVSESLKVSGTTSRDNLAATLVACLHLENTIGKSFSILDGNNDLQDALKSM
jgi:hypothetical protein